MKLDQYEKELVSIAEEIVYYLMRSGISKDDGMDVTQDVLVKMLESNFCPPPRKNTFLDVSGGHPQLYRLLSQGKKIPGNLATGIFS